VDGQVYAQPLYVSALNLAGGTHNVVYVCTEHNSVYAFDANTGGAPLWHVNVGPSITDQGCTNINPEYGITSTPVIDLSTNTIYVESKSKVGTNYFHTLHALDLSTGAEKFGAPVNITATVGGVTFTPFVQAQRPGLLLLNGVVYIGFASHCDNGAYHGWLLGYTAGPSTIAQSTAFCITPTGTDGGIWSCGMAPSADANGFIYIITGNGTWDGTANFGDSFLKFSTAGGLKVADYFTPHNQAALSSADLDLGSGGAVLLPTHYVVGMAKSGSMYLCDTNNMGKFNANTDTCLQVFSATAESDTVSSSPVYWVGPSKQYLFIASGNDTAKSYQFTGTNVNTTALGHGSVADGQNPGGSSLSSNGTANGIFWTIAENNTLYAYDAVNFPTMLWNSGQNAGRDALGAYIKFATPTIANGMVYVGTTNQLVAYGLIPQQVAAPVFSPGGSTYFSTQNVTISDSTSGASIRYTLDGSTPSETAGTLYTGPVNISSTATLKAIAYLTGDTDSPITSATYAIATSIAINAGGPAVSPFVADEDFTGGATINHANTINTSKVTNPAPAAVYQTAHVAATAGGGSTFSYTIPGFTAGSTNTVRLHFCETFWTAAGSRVFNVSINGTQVLTNFDIFATAGGQNIANIQQFTPAANSSGQYVIVFTSVTDKALISGIEIIATTTPAAPSFSPAPGSYTSAQSVTISDTTTGASIYYTTDGSTPTTSSTLYSGPVAIAATTTLQAIANNSNGSSTVTGGTYTLTPPAAPSFSPAPGSYSSAQSVTISDTTAGASIFYTTDGSTPTTSSTLYSGPVAIAATTTLQAIASDNFGSSSVTGGTYTLTPPAAPSFSPAPGSYTSAQSVTISDTTAGASIYYTTDGSTPTTSSTLYSGPVAIAATTTLQAIASDSFGSSSVTSGTYTITPPAAPSFSPAPGSYSSAQSVTISDTTAGASIYYTTDGSTPTTSSTLYSGPVAIAATTTLKAIASDSIGSSSVTSGTYTIASGPITLQATNLTTTGSGQVITPATDAAAPGGTWVKIASTAVGQWIQFTTPSIPAGTYSLSFICRTAPTRAQHNVTIDGTQVGATVDQYAAISGYPTMAIGSVTFATAGTHTIRLTATGKNAASTDFQISACQFIFQ
jgi:Malectin domain/Chitobiase/beta-hexosaminidase C-terminal domain/Fn3 associated/DUF5010 C-terminal domain/PQQ enzyme repeat